MATRFLCSGCGISLKLSTGSAISEKVSSFYPIQLRTHTHRQTRKQQQQQQHMLKSGKRRYSMCTCVHLARGLRAVSTVTKGTDKLLYNNRENRCRREKAKKELLMCRAPSSLRWFYTIDKWRRVRVPPPPICAKVFVCVTVECNQFDSHSI
jgi:hypothetical protein